MLKNWGETIVTDINLAIYVSPDTGGAIHTNRGFHGFVINDEAADKRIHFSDGTILKTGPHEVHYLPKGSSYRVESITRGGCWAINFDLLEDINEAPFNISFRNHESILKDFKDAVAAWEEKPEFHNALIRKCIYSIIVKIKKEYNKTYTPNKKERLIQPAIETILRDYKNCDLSVKDLSALCGISEAYFRRIFMDKFSISPKEYIISLRIEQAKRLLESGQFSVTEVAQMSGYNEPCHFSREFKKIVGKSPKEYAK